MRVTVHQPDFMPWLGFFARWRDSDLYVVLDDVQFLRRGWHHRDRIMTAAGPAWLTVPVRKSGRFNQDIRDVEVENGPWRRKHLAAIAAAYARSPRFAEIFPLLEEVYGRDHARLMDLNLDILRLFARLLGITTPLTMASQHGLAETGTARLVRLCALHGADAYLTGMGSRDYLDEALFTACGIRVEWQEFRPAPYPQLHGAFVPCLSTLDFLMMARDALSSFAAQNTEPPQVDVTLESPAQSRG
ncbi:MAG: WbqC family protein [Thermodesulfobacteriota bacterium]